MQKYFKIFISAVLAGVLIGVGATVYLAVLSASKIAGAFLFAFGLFTIIQLNLFLYTGKVGFVLENKPNYFADLAIGLIGNFLGIVAFCFMLSATRLGDAISPQASTLVAAKQGDTFYSIFLLGFACGIMVYLAVKGHKVAETGIAKTIMCFGAVAIFILCGFEHCIANAAYYVYARVFNWKALGYFALTVLGNSLGAIATDGLLKLLQEKKSDDAPNPQ